MTERTYTNRHGVVDTIYSPPHDQPFIVTYISVGEVGWVAAGRGPEALLGNSYRNVEWNWHEHFVRIYPPTPTWEQLQEAGKVVTS